MRHEPKERLMINKQLNPLVVEALERSLRNKLGAATTGELAQIVLDVTGRNYPPRQLAHVLREEPRLQSRVLPSGNIRLWRLD